MTRLSTSVLVGALLRKAEADGGFAAVLAKGDENAGAVLILLSEKGSAKVLLERILQSSGSYAWQHSELGEDAPWEAARRLVERRRRYDPDLWVIELDVPSWERFAAQMGELD